MKKSLGVILCLICLAIIGYFNLGSANASCNIKGNINFSGEKIYHFPGCEYYNSTNIHPSYGERRFCTESDARAAGWRRAYNCPGSYNGGGSTYPTCNGCELNGSCYSKPANASCVNNDPNNAWICNSGHKEVGNSCQKVSEVKVDSSMIYSRNPIDYSYWGSDRNKHCNHNRPGTSFDGTRDMCLCPSGREFWEGYGCGTKKIGDSYSELNGETPISKSRPFEDQRSFSKACEQLPFPEKFTPHAVDVFCDCTVDQLGSEYENLSKMLSVSRLRSFTTTMASVGEHCINEAERELSKNEDLDDILCQLLGTCK